MKIIPKIPVIYPGQFPRRFINDVNGWAFSAETLKKNLGRLLTLDIDFGNYCTLNCPHCFRRNNRVDYGHRKLMGYDDLVKLIKDAEKLGLRSVKFLGAGEPFQNERLVEFLRFLKQEDIIPLVFTKGHVIGDDREVAKWNSRYGIRTGKELVRELKRLNVSILLGFNSFDTAVQDKMVGGIKGYTRKRNRALKLLVDSGFNKTNPTRLSLIVAPITNENRREIPALYRWARERNLYPIACPTMVSGRCSAENTWEKVTPSAPELVKTYTDIYRFNLARGIHTPKALAKEGIASYVGAHPCSQVACGMYVTLTGVVLRCPGDDTTVLGNIWEEPLASIWKNSENYGRAGTFNCGCPPKYGKSIPYNLYTEVRLRLHGKN